MPNFLIRAADISDLSDFFELALVAGAGFTSLPADEALLADRLRHSKSAFLGNRGMLMLALEDLDIGRVIGCAAIKIGNGERSDFLNFLVDDKLGCLSSTSIYQDLTEVGSLLVHPDYRRYGVGRWLARSRYLLISSGLPRFGDLLFSELRGLIDEDRHSPFYDGVLAPHFALTYEEADYLCTHGRQFELNAMLPSLPIWTDEIGAVARAAIGQPHQEGSKALWFLKEEGFRFEGVVDLLDGGPLVCAPSRDVMTIRSSYKANITLGEVGTDDADTMILAFGEGNSFRTVKGLAVRRGDHVVVSHDLLARAGAKPGVIALCCLDREHEVSRRLATGQAELCES